MRRAWMKPPLRCDRGSVDVLVETASAIETGVERTGAVAAGLRIASYVGAVIVPRGVGRTDGVPLVSPDCAHCVILGGNGDVVTEERHPATAELPRVVLDAIGLLALLLLCGSSLCHRQNPNRCRRLGLVHVYAVTQRPSEAVEPELHDI